MKKINWMMSATVLLFLLAGLAICFAFFSSTAQNEQPPQRITLEGEYRIGDGQWQPIAAGIHIPATKGDVFLRGHLMRTAPDGQILGPLETGQYFAFYFNHVGGHYCIDDGPVYTFDSENPKHREACCGKQWESYEYTGNEDSVVELLIRNAHKFGNETAVDDLLSSMYLYADDSLDNYLIQQGSFQRGFGTLIVVIALVLIGVALLSTLTKVAQQGLLWQIGIAVLMSGCFLMMDAPNVDQWSSSITVNTNVALSSAMLYAVFLQTLICRSQSDRMRGPANLAVILTVIVTGAVFCLSLPKHVLLYDLLPLWLAGLTVSSLVQVWCCLCSIRGAEKNSILLLIAYTSALLSILADIAATAIGWWQGSMISITMFTMMLGIALIMALKIIPSSIRAVTRERELEAELERSKTAIMLSQIQPHFLYNSLGAIRALCRQDPEEAREALDEFIVYLRGNVDSLKSDRAVHFTKELSHIEAYLKLEQLRFGDSLNVVYDIGTEDFFVPSLTVQPLVENAVKHGVCSTEESGTVLLRTREMAGNIVITISDDGVGFDPGQVKEEEHVGIRNVRSRLRDLAQGALYIDSSPGRGTTATIVLPKYKG